ncbi:UPF0489 family protein, partial [Paenibacillus nuruki]|uniref:UPF0489 family protein n=1 Tax=Paenibacillus nuruki TaxID=1886670 RepID=UPI00084695EF
MRVLDIDMDFFLNEVAIGKSFNGERLSDDEYIPWREKEIRDFLELRCGLEKNKKIKGQLFEEHVGVFHYLRDEIIKEKLTTPFELIHVDAHADLGLGDGAWAYIFEKYLSFDINKRMNIHDYTSELKQIERLASSNYLLFAIACEWISNLVYVTNPMSSGDDYLRDIMKAFQDNSDFIQLKYYFEGINFCEELENQKFIPQTKVAFNIIKDYQIYKEDKTHAFDYIVFSQSLS